MRYAHSCGKENFGREIRVEFVLNSEIGFFKKKKFRPSVRTEKESIFPIKNTDGKA